MEIKKVIRELEQVSRSIVLRHKFKFDKVFALAMEVVEMYSEDSENLDMIYYIADDERLELEFSMGVRDFIALPSFSHTKYLMREYLENPGWYNELHGYKFIDLLISAYLPRNILDINDVFDFKSNSYKSDLDISKVMELTSDLKDELVDNDDLKNELDEIIEMYNEILKDLKELQ